MVTLDELAALAEQATPGPWGMDPRHPLHLAPYVGAAGTGLSAIGEYVATTATDAEGQGIRDARYIAACSPEVIKALVAVAQAAEGWESTRHEAEYEPYRTATRALSDALDALRAMLA